MSAKKSAARPAAKKSARKAPRRLYRPGAMGRKEIQPLVLAAREAFDYQGALGNIDPGVAFDDWRRDQVKQAVGRAGLTDCVHDDFRPLMAHFKLLAGRDGEALESFLATGPATDHAAAGDDHETRRQLAHQIMQILGEHVRLADISAVDLAAQTPDTALYQTLRARRAAILAHPQGALREGYLVHLARQKTRRPDLRLGTDIEAGLADRCTADQLAQIRNTLVNRIAVREDRPESEGGRNRGRRASAGLSSAPRSIHEIGSRIEPAGDDPF
jgi:DNA-binding transcriptional ArsR family regulator